MIIYTKQCSVSFFYLYSIRCAWDTRHGLKPTIAKPAEEFNGRSRPRRPVDAR